MTAKNLYAYTLQPVPYEVSDVEQRQAQLFIWRSTNKISTKVWIIMAAVIVLSIIGIVSIKNYSTVMFWVAIATVVIFFLIPFISSLSRSGQKHRRSGYGGPVIIWGGSDWGGASSSWGGGSGGSSWGGGGFSGGGGSFGGGGASGGW